ncbi:MAG: protein translocase subunit SecD [Treponemataceae bacterium]|nr:protein translocase subunit SecD [Treponemataceae bacterium]
MSKRNRFFIILVVLVICFAFLWPSIAWYFLTPKDAQTLALGSLEKIKDYSRIMATQDVATLSAAARTNSAAELPESFSYLKAEAKKNCKLYNKPAPEVWTYGSVLGSFTSQDELSSVIEKKYRDEVLKNKNRYSRSVKLGLDLSGGMSVIVKADLESVVASQKELGLDNEQTVKEDAMAQAIDTLKGRIDRFGLTEPVIRKQGEDRIYIEVPGAADAESINSIIMGKGILNFRYVDTEATNAFMAFYTANPGRVFDANGNLLDPSLVPEGKEVIGNYTKDSYGLDERIGYIVVEKEPVLDGKYIKSADISSDRVGKPQVCFTLDSEGAAIFGAFTAAHVNESMAIVSDNKIKSCAVINEPIPNGQVAISGFGYEEAQNLKKVLQTAWLSVPLEIESQQVIGAGLGDAAIQQGKKALIIGLVAVLVFMIIWYLGAGINAVVAQILNLFIMFSVLSALGLTLTLSSIAGMVLTIGMAVDANVIIFERIKEERALGKSRAASIAAGFDHALWAILDSNITTLIAALFLSQLGTGTIQGFAVSLAIGVCSSVFTALVVSHLMFDFNTDVMHKEKISIGWRVK